MISVPYIEINLDNIKEGLRLWIEPRKPNTLFDARESSFQNHEARFQLLEGHFYDYEINHSDFLLGDIGENIIQHHIRKANFGTIAPNIFVGTLTIPIINKNNLEECFMIELEVQSFKSGYRDDYLEMLKFISEKCNELLLKANAPNTQQFEIDYTLDAKTLYQKFAFINSIVGTEEFSEAIHRIITSPVTKWSEKIDIKDIRNVKRFSNNNLKEIVKGVKRIEISHDHYLKRYGLSTMSEKITYQRKTDSVDTPENRFIKYALESFLKISSEIYNKSKEFGHNKLEKESGKLMQQLENHLHHSVFKDISRPTLLKLNSPVLQRKEGYREVLRVWLMFELTAKLIWTGGEDVYSGGKKDIATLYEYWLFFVLLDLFQNIFKIEPKDISDLIQTTADGLNLQIKQGINTAIKGIYDTDTRKLNIRFNYNRSFSGKKNYPDSGSWTTTLRPDYTLSFWPYGIDEIEAERQELIVHVHFDAKYKLTQLADLFSQKDSNDSVVIAHLPAFQLKRFNWEYIFNLLLEKGFAEKDKNDSINLVSFSWKESNELGDIKGDDFKELVEYIQQLILTEEKTENRKGIYKNADLLKMHAYKDAIRRTGGAYVLYPGDTTMKRKGFHEIIPGLGAFGVSPSKNDDGIRELKSFIIEILDHFINRTSQREKLAFRTFDIHKEPPVAKNEVRELLPETYNHNRGLQPDDIQVLVGYYKSPEHYEWIKKNKLYNFRTGTGNGSLVLERDTVNSSYLLLHTKGDHYSGELWKIISNGPKVLSNNDLIKKNYPSPTKELYLVIELEKVIDKEFENVKWDFKALKNYQSNHLSAIPFTTNLSELMLHKVK